MLARELDPVSQSRYVSNQGGHRRTKKGRGPQCPCLVHPVLSSHSAIYAARSKDVAYPCTSAAVAWSQRVWWPWQTPRTEWPMSCTCKGTSMATTTSFGLFAFSSSDLEIERVGENDRRICYFPPLSFESFSRVRYTDLFISPEHISLLSLPKQQ